MSQEELEDIRQGYIASLADLTDNFRLIIDNLTVIAQENIHAAKIITKTIEDHISKVRIIRSDLGLFLGGLALLTLCNSFCVKVSAAT